MNAQNFHVGCPRLVEEYIDSVSKHVRPLEYNGIVHILYDDSQDMYCITPAKQYHLPPAIVELLGFEIIEKLHGNELILGLRSPNWDISVSVDTLMWDAHDSCSMCDGTPVYNRTICEFACDSCAVQVENVEHITDDSVLDWVQFMCEFQYGLAYKYYVNCNPYSDAYGMVMSVYETDNDCVAHPQTLCHADELLTHIQQWFNILPCVGDNHRFHDAQLFTDPLFYISKCMAYLDSKLSLPHSQYETLPRRHILEVDVYEHDPISMDVMRGIIMRYWSHNTDWLYRNDKCRSFGYWADHYIDTKTD